MKKILLAIILYSVFCSAQQVSAQMVYMPDSMLRLKLTNLGFGTCISGDSIDSSCPLVLSTTSLDVSAYSILSLEGLQVFSALNKLQCYSNPGLIMGSYLPSTIDTLIAYSCLPTTLPYLPPGLKYLECYNDSLTTLPTLPNSLVTLFCYKNKLASLPNLPASLTFLYCQENLLATLPSLPNSLIDLSCQNNSLHNLPTLPNTLTTLEASDNPLYSLPILSTSLRYLYCRNDSLSSLPSLPSTLMLINCGWNQITALPALPSSLTILDCSRNQLTSLPSLPISLTHLSTGNNLITNLPVLPSSLVILNCFNNQLVSLPSLPSTLTTLNCYNNFIPSLPVLPTVLEILSCGDNPLGVLPTLPISLQYLYCNNTGISIMPALPASLTELYCSVNFITVFPSLPMGLINLECDSNLLIAIPDLPDSMNLLSLKYNYQLNCLPQLKNIRFLYFDGCPVTCIPNYGNVYYGTPLLNSLPLCDVFNSSGCNFYWNISGKAFHDIDTNCLKSQSERSLKNMHINLYQNNTLVQQAFTGGQGLYSFDVNGLGNYEVKLDTALLPFTSVCPVTNSYLDTISASDSLFYDNDFAVQCKNGFDVGVWTIYSAILRPSHLSGVTVYAGDLANFYGVHCASGVSGTITITINGNAHYFGTVPGSLAPSNVTGNIISYTVADFDSLIWHSAFRFIMETDTNATVGSTICIDATVAPLSNDNNVLNNSLSKCFVVHASLDPNFKEVFPEGITDTSQHDLSYTIHFQNTGNAPADNIYILDTLDNNIDLSSFQLLATSHPAYVQILDGGIVRFNFPNINLPDSVSDEPNSHGYAQYKARLKPNLPIGTQINNTAYIFFDFNQPVVTNTTTNTIAIINSTTNISDVSSIIVWPNPFNNEFNIQIDPTLKGSHYSVVNLLGDQISNGLVEQRLTINSTNWTSGIYFLRIESERGIVIRRLLKS